MSQTAIMKLERTHITRAHQRIHQKILLILQRTHQKVLLTHQRIRQRIHITSLQTAQTAIKKHFL